MLLICFVSKFLLAFCQKEQISAGHALSCMSCFRFFPRPCRRIDLFSFQRRENLFFLESRENLVKRSGPRSGEHGPQVVDRPKRSLAQPAVLWAGPDEAVMRGGRSLAHGTVEPRRGRWGLRSFLLARVVIRGNCVNL